MIDEETRLEIMEMIKDALTGRITQMMIPSDTIKSRHVGEGVRFIRSGLSTEIPTEGELDGAVFYETDTDTLQIWDGSSWNAH